MRGGVRVAGIGLLLSIAAAGGWLANNISRLAEPNEEPRDTSSMHSQAPGRPKGPCANGLAPLYWRAPMDPNYVRKEPGKSPMGMDLVPECPSGGEEARAGMASSNEVRINSSLVQKMGVRTAAVERRDLTRYVRAVGRVTYDERLVHHVHTKIHGWVEKLYVEYEGGIVGAGEPLLEIYSPELVSTQEELLLAARYRETTKASSNEDVRRSGQELLEATRRRLELWDISEQFIDDILTSGEVRKTVTLYAPRKGVVTHLNVRHGMEVTSDKNLYTIAGLSRVWIYANVYEYELPWLEIGQSASVKLKSRPGTSFEAVISYIYPSLDADTRTARVRLELDNPDLIFKPNMFAVVEIRASQLSGVLAVPEEAVIRSGQRSLVILDLGEGRFAPRDVTLGLDSGDGWLEIVAGLTESERVVTSGQFLIDSESKLREAAQKLLSSEAR